MVRFLLSFCFFLSISPMIGQVTVELKSIVTDRMTRSPISYANVGFVDRGLGTVSDDTGYFELSFAEKRINDNDLIQVTANGYYPLCVPFSVFKSAINKTKILYLSPIENPLETEENHQLDNKTLMSKEMGYTVYDDLMYVEWSETDQKGMEYATIINLPQEEVILKSLKFKIEEHNAEKTTVRINVYEVDNVPTRKIITSVYHTIYKKEGEEVVKLEKVCKPVSNKIAVGIEWLGSSGREKNDFLRVAMSKDLGTTFMKSTSQDNWQELPYHAIGFSMEVMTSSSRTIGDQTKIEGHRIKGIVTMSGKPVQGCEVRVKGELLYTQTREDGSFDISAAKDDVLEFRSLTTKPMDLTVHGKDDFRIILEPKYDQLEEVLLKAKKEEIQEEERMYMTAFGPKNPGKSGFRVVHKTKEELNKTAVNFSDLIAGQFPAPRGSSSIVLSNSRAIVVDGVVMDKRLNPDDFLSPGMIASVTLVPSVGGNVMYGSAGRNGVIYVTTKNAESNWKFLKQKEKANNLLTKNNEYDNAAEAYNDTVIEDVYGFKNTETIAEAKARYVGTLSANMTNIDFYITAFKYFLDRDNKYAYEVLKTARGVAWNSPKALRSLSFMYEEQEKFEEAHMLYVRIGELEPLRSQTYLDLAQSHVSTRNYQKAFSLYKLMLDNKIPGVIFSDEVMEVVVTEVKHLVTQHKLHVDYRDLHPSFYSKALDLDGRIVIEWNDPQSEFEFQFVNPDNKFFKWSYVAESNYQGVLASEKEGYQTKEFFVDNAETGKWLINMNTIGSDDKSGTVPRLVKCIMYKNYGTPDEIRTIKIINLNHINKNTLIGAISMQ